MLCSGWIKACAFLQRVLDSRMAGISCLFIAMLNKCTMAWLYSSLKGDKALYLLMTQNLLHGNGLTEAVTLAETGVTVNLYDGGVHSPLYPVLCAPFLWATKSYFVTQLLVAWGGWVFFFWGLYRLARLYFRQRWVAHLFILCVGGFIYPQEMQSSPKDTIAAALAIWVAVFIHRFISGRPTVLTGAALGLLLIALCSIKILYVPIAIALLTLTLLLCFLNHGKKSTWPVAAMLTALFAGMLLYASLVLPPRSTKNLLPALPSDNLPYTHGFFPENLSLTYPFISSALVETELVAMQAEVVKPGGFIHTMRTLYWADMVFAIVLLATAIVYSKSIWNNKLMLLLITAALAVMAGAVYKSLSEQAISYKSATTGWTYVSDARNFLVPMLVLQLLLFWFVFEGRRLLMVRLLLLVLFAGSAVHGYLFVAKKFISTPFVAEANVNRDALKKTVDYLKAENAADEKVTLITSDKALRRYAEVNGLPAYNFSDEQAAFEWMKKRQRFVIATHAADSAYLQKLPAQGLVLVDTIPPFIIHSFVNE